MGLGSVASWVDRPTSRSEGNPDLRPLSSWPPGHLWSEMEGPGVCELIRLAAENALQEAGAAVHPERAAHSTLESPAALPGGGRPWGWPAWGSWSGPAPPGCRPVDREDSELGSRHGRRMLTGPADGEAAAVTRNCTGRGMSKRTRPQTPVRLPSRLGRARPSPGLPGRAQTLGRVRPGSDRTPAASGESGALGGSEPQGPGAPSENKAGGAPRPDPRGCTKRLQEGLCDGRPQPCAVGVRREGGHAK